MKHAPITEKSEPDFAHGESDLPFGAARPFDVPRLAIAQLTWAARRALASVAPGCPFEQRYFDVANRCATLLATRVPHWRRAPRNAGLIRQLLEFGTGLQQRAIGRQAAIALEGPFAAEAKP